MYQGTIVEESLIDNRLINSLKIVGVRITSEDKSEDRWHLYKVQIEESDIETLSSKIKNAKWYMHFWYGDDVYVVFHNKIFRISYKDKNTWKEAVDFGLSMGIPKEQLDFVSNNFS